MAFFMQITGALHCDFFAFPAIYSISRPDWDPEALHQHLSVPMMNIDILSIIYIDEYMLLD